MVMVVCIFSLLFAFLLHVGFVPDAFRQVFLTSCCMNPLLGWLYGQQKHTSLVVLLLVVPPVALVALLQQHLYLHRNETINILVNALWLLSPISVCLYSTQTPNAALKIACV